MNMMNSSILKAIVTFLIFLILGFSIYWNTLDTPFYLDDVARIQDNTSIRISNLSFNQIKNAAFGKNLSNNRPIGNITFALNYYFHKYDLAGYHILNITIHILTGFFLFLFVRTTLSEFNCNIIGQTGKIESDKIFNPKNIALAVALIWLVHPLNTNSVTYIVQRVNSLASMFFLLSFLLYAKGRIAQINFSEIEPESFEQKNQNSKSTKQKKERTYNRKTDIRGLKIKQPYLFFAGSALSWLMALGCKQTAATLPFFIFIYEWFFFQNLDRDWLQNNLKYIIGTVVLFGLIAFLYLGPEPLNKISSIADFANKEFTFTERILTQSRVVIYYLSLFFYPHPSRLNLDHDFPLSHSLIDPLTTLLSLIIIIGAIGIAFYLVKKERLLSFCILWYFGNLIIESSIIPLAIIFEHRTYLPSMLISLIIVMLLNRYMKIRWLKISILCAIIAVFSVWTYQRNITWADKVTFWNDSAAKSPGKARPHYNLGMALAEQEKMSEAINHFSTALKLKPNFYKVHNSLGSVFMNLGRTDEAIKHFFEVLKLDSQNTLAYYNLGVAFAIQGKISEAVNYYSNAIRIDPGYTDALMNLGNIMANQGFMNEAIRYYNNALEIEPYNENIHYNLGIILINNGKIEESIQHFREAIRIKPEFTEAGNSLDQSLKIQKAIKESIPQILDMLKDDPKNPTLYFQLGGLYVTSGNHTEAIEQYQKALRIQPDFPQALHRLAVLYANRKEYDKSASMFKKIARLSPENAGTYYNIACMYAQQNKIEESISWLKKAINKGYNKWDLIKTDKDLKNIRESSQYHELINGH